MSLTDLFYIDPAKARVALARAALLNQTRAELYDLMLKVLPAHEGKQITARIRNAIHSALLSGYAIQNSGAQIIIWRQGGDHPLDWTHRFTFTLQQNPETLCFDYQRTVEHYSLKGYADCAAAVTDAARLAETIDADVANYNDALTALRAAHAHFGTYKYDVVSAATRSAWG